MTYPALFSCAVRRTKPISGQRLARMMGARNSEHSMVEDVFRAVRRISVIEPRLGARETITPEGATISSTMAVSLEAKRADQPFQFMAASYLIRIGAQPVQTLGELAKSLRSCPQASIFYHTFQSLEAHHYTSFSSDFAQWALTACNEAALAEQLAIVDLREIVSLEDLRGILADIVSDYLKEHPQAADRRAFEAFYFCEAREVTVPSGSPAWTLPELAEGIRHLGHQSLHYHFINSRLRLQLKTNDFSYWIERSLNHPWLAARLNRIDFYNDTLDELRQDILDVLEPAETQ